MVNSDKIFGNVYISFDYEKFKFLDGNRDVSHSDVIEDSCKRFAQLLSPIIVNEQYYIIDGQNRFAAFKNLGLPIYYIVAEGYGIKECIELNVSSKNWGIDDYVRSYAKRGYESYILLEEMQKKYGKILTKQFVRTMAYGNMQFSPNRAIMSGTFKALERDYLEEKFDWLSQFRFERVRGNRSVLYTVLSFCYDFGDCDNKKMSEQYAKFSNLITDVTDTKLAAEAIEKLYNYGRGKKYYVYIASEYKKAADARNFVMQRKAVD